MRRAAALLILSLACSGANAASWSDLWSTRDQQAQRLLPQDPAKAATLFTDPRRRAYAELAAGHYPQAAELLKPFGDADSQYNRGNALAQSGKLQEALAAYDAALKQAPQDADIRHNRELVAQALKGQPPQSKDGQHGGQQPQGQNSQDKPGQDQQGQDGQGQGQGQGQQQAQNGSQNGQQKGQQNAQQNAQHGSSGAAGGRDAREGQGSHNNQDNNQDNKQNNPSSAAAGAGPSGGQSGSPHSGGQNGPQQAQSPPGQQGASPGSSQAAQARTGSNSSSSNSPNNQSNGQNNSQGNSGTPAAPGTAQAGAASSSSGAQAQQAQADAAAGAQYLREQQNRNTHGPDATAARTVAGEPRRAADTDAPRTPPSEESLATEQWLQRIPEDSGELLRRKFRIEHNMRHPEQDAEP